MKHLQWRHERAWLEQMASCLRLFALNLLLNSAHQCGLGEKWELRSAIYIFAVSPLKQQRKLCIKISYVGIWILPDVDARESPHFISTRFSRKRGDSCTLLVNLSHWAENRGLGGLCTTGSETFPLLTASNMPFCKGFGKKWRFGYLLCSTEGACCNVHFPHAAELQFIPRRL